MKPRWRTTMKGLLRAAQKGPRVKRIVITQGCCRLAVDRNPPRLPGAVSSREMSAFDAGKVLELCAFFATNCIVACAASQLMRR